MSIKDEQKRIQREKSKMGHQLKKLHREERIAHKLVLPNSYTSKQALTGLIVLVTIFAITALFCTNMGQSTAQAVEPFKNPPDVDLQGGVVWDPCGLDSVICPDEAIDQQIKNIANKHNYSVDELIALATCESNLNPDAVGGEIGCFHGLYQWNLCANGSSWMSNECAHDINCSTIETINALNKGEQWRWLNCI